MAKATAGRRQTTRKITLRLTEGEADFLLAVTALASGHPSKSPRKYGERVRKALEDALGYDYESTDAFPLSLGGTHFADYDSNGFDLGEKTLATFAILEAAGVRTPLSDLADLDGALSTSAFEVT